MILVKQPSDNQNVPMFVAKQMDDVLNCLDTQYGKERAANAGGNVVLIDEKDTIETLTESCSFNTSCFENLASIGGGWYVIWQICEDKDFNVIYFMNYENVLPSIQELIDEFVPVIQIQQKHGERDYDVYDYCTGDRKDAASHI